MATRWLHALKINIKGGEQMHRYNIFLAVNGPLYKQEHEPFVFFYEFVSMYRVD